MKIGFLGFGNIAKAMLEGLTYRNKKLLKEIYASSAHYDKLLKNTKKYGINACKSNEELIDTCDLIFICCKPYQVKDVLEGQKLEGKILVSLAAGIYSKDFEEFIPGTHHITCIPNTAISVAEGVLVVEDEHTLTEEEFDLVEKLLKKVGLIEVVETAKMDIATTIAGCTPAYTAMYLEALGDAACKYGLSREVGYRLVAKMLEGTGKMALESGKHPGELKDAVCSPKGTTIKGVAALEKRGFRGTVIKAIDKVMD